MKTLVKIIIILPILLFVSCQKKSKNLTATDEQNKLLGHWAINSAHSELIEVYERVHQLKQNNYGFTFQKEKIFIERKNSGWCGTPPIVYEDYKGSWSQKDSLINITVGYWGGKVNYQWKIISITDKHLKIQKLKTKYKKNK